eukprot:3009538-Rhodomonas_salina.5
MIVLRLQRRGLGSHLSPPPPPPWYPTLSSRHHPHQHHTTRPSLPTLHIAQAKPLFLNITSPSHHTTLSPRLQQHHTTPPSLPTLEKHRIALSRLRRIVLPRPLERSLRASICSTLLLPVPTTHGCPVRLRHHPSRAARYPTPNAALANECSDSDMRNEEEQRL